MGDWWYRRSRWAKIGIGFASFLAVISAIAVAAEPPASELADLSPTPVPVLTIRAPRDGAVVDTPSIQFVGSAPAGSEVVQNISFASDKRTSADSSGNWVLTVDLDEGINDVVLRIGSEDATSKTIRVTYRMASPSPSQTPTLRPTPTPTPSGTESATPTAASTATPTSRPTARPTQRPTPRPTQRPSSIAVLDDPLRDTVDGDGNRVTAPGYADIESVSLKAEGDDYVFTIFTAGDIVWRDGLNESTYYGWWLDVDHDDDPDYIVSLESGPERNEWYGSLFSYDDSYTYADTEFPGVAQPLGKMGIIRLEMDAIGNPRRVRAAAVVEWIRWADISSDPFDYEEAFDRAPDTQYPEDGAEWLEVGP